MVMDVNQSLDVNLDICLVIQRETLASGTGNLNWIAKLRVTVTRSFLDRKVMNAILSTQSQMTLRLQ